MRRMHLIEFEDLPWFPRPIRDAMTDFLSHVGELTIGPYRDFVRALRHAMGDSGERRIVDLCSGAGGPARAIARLLAEEHHYPVDLLLTDLYPNQRQWDSPQKPGAGTVAFAPEPVDATRVPEGTRGFRLLCNGFHHFRPDQARAILRDAVARHQGIAVFEAIDPGSGGITQPFLLLAMMLGLTPFIRPFRFSRLFFTYIIPAAPVFLLWDGLVSWLRIYSPDDLKELIASVEGTDGYEWEIGRARIPASPLRNVFLIGKPRAAARGLSCA